MEHFQSIIEISDKLIKNGALYLFAFLLIAGLGFGTGSSWGCAVYILIPLMVIEGNRYKDEENDLNMMEGTDR